MSTFLLISPEDGRLFVEDKVSAEYLLSPEYMTPSFLEDLKAINSAPEAFIAWVESAVPGDVFAFIDPKDAHGACLYAAHVIIRCPSHD